MKGRRIPNCISLAQAIVALKTFDRQQMFINCLSPIDLELRFLGTIFCEMDDLDQISPGQTLIHLWDWENKSWGHNIIYLKGHLTV